MKQILTRWKGLAQFFSLLFVMYYQCVQISAASYLELHAILVLLYLHR